MRDRRFRLGVVTGGDPLVERYRHPLVCESYEVRGGHEDLRTVVEHPRSIGDIQWRRSVTYHTTSWSWPIGGHPNSAS